MEIWLDTANLDVIDQAKSMGILCGVTTNPKIIGPGLHAKETLAQLLARQDGPVAVQVVSDNAEEMVREAESLLTISRRIIVKIPVTCEGLLAIHRLARQGLPVMATMIFEPYQALLAMRAGASYIAIYYGRMEDPERAMEQILALKTHYAFDTKVLVASVRSSDVINSVLELGVHAITINERLFEQITAVHPGVNKALDEFAEATLTSPATI